MEQQKIAKPKLKASIEYKDAKASIQTQDTDLYDIGIVFIIIAGIVGTIYLLRRKKK